jgi:thiosulfate/3-mercaptopyruvate sulfurtransferase
MYQVIKEGKMRLSRKILVGIVSLFFVLSFFGYQIAYAEGNQPLVETQWLADNLSNVKPVYVGFIGENDFKKFEGKHIPGSVYLGMNDLMGALGNGSAPPDKATFEGLMSKLGISKDSHVVLYGTPAGNPFVPGAFWLMKYFGHEKVSILNGSFDKWNNEGRKTSGAPEKVKSTSYKAETGDESIRADANHVLNSLKNSNVILIDTRGADEYVGKEDRNKRKGHIPGAINMNFYPSNRNSNGTYKSASALKATYEAKGVTKDKEIITYCETGPRAADSYFVLKYLLSYPNVKVYIGSWREWGNDLDPEKYPLEK